MEDEITSWPDHLPGPGLATALAEIDLAGLDDGELIDVLAAWRRQASWAQAGELAAVAELGRRRGSSGEAEFASAEVGLALVISPRSADAHLDLADTLAERLPLTRTALTEGRIDLVKARIIAQGTRAVEAEIAQAAEERVLPGAEQVTPGRLRARVERAVIALDPAGAERRRRAGEADRRIECYDTGNGTAILGGVHLPAGPAIAADNRVHAIAKALKTDGDTRTQDQLSADVFLSLLLGTHPASGLTTTGNGSVPPPGDDIGEGPDRTTAEMTAETTAETRTADSPAVHADHDQPRINRSVVGDVRQGTGRQDGAWHGAAERGGRDAGLRADPAAIARGVGERIGTVHLTVPLTTLLGLSAEPGEAAGYGPLTAEAARQMAATATSPATRWCLTVTGADGAPLHHGHLAYRPPTAMAHTVRALQPTCRFPGCTRPSKDCDLDHRTPYHQGGRTCPCNLQPLCRRHHRAKGTKGWTVTQQPDGLSWTTPAGKTYTTHPEPPPPPRPIHPPNRTSPVEARLRRCLRGTPRTTPTAHNHPSAASENTDTGLVAPMLM